MKPQNTNHKSQIIIQKLIFVLILIPSFILTSCLDNNQEELVGDRDPSILLKKVGEVSYSNTLKDQLAEKVAKNIAESVADPEVINFLRTKASEKIDGDFNFLIELNRNESIGTSSTDINKRTRTFGSIIAGADLISKRTANVEDLLDSIARIHPLLQVYMPEFSDEATDKLGSSVVEYCDGIGSDGFMYDTGSLFFQAQ